ncbi:hypothetical protein [Williamsia soli]|uniref:hypothetical protein n=1 Tax=Williamsia soli TaxID=364929 RepID=UPI001A9EF996|nr:hypothetical protein [Williamsia soli]
MTSEDRPFNSKQLAFKELFVGALIYAVVLGFFNDYTSLVYATSFSTIFFAAIVLEILTLERSSSKAGLSTISDGARDWPINF